MRTPLLLISALISFNVTAQVHWISYQPPPILGVTVIKAYQMDIDTGGNIWQIVDDLNSDNWLMKFDGTNWTIPDSNFCPNYLMGTFSFDKNNSIWCGYHQQIYKWNNGILTTYTVPTSISNSGHEFFCNDANNNMWFISSNYITKFDGNNFTLFDSSTTGIPAGERFNDMFLNNNNEIFASTDSSGIFKFDGNSWQSINSSNSNLPPNVSIQGITSDSIGNLYALGYWKNSNNIFFSSYKNGSFNYYTLPSDFQPYGYDMMIDSSNNVFYYSNYYNLIKYNGSFFTAYNQPYTFADCLWSRIDKKGNIWISGNGASMATLLSFDPNGFQTVQGLVFDDQNQNGSHDFNEPGLKSEMLMSSIGSYTVTDSNGFFALPYVDSTQTFVLTHQLKHYRVQTSIPPAYYITPSSGVTNNYDFGIYTLPNVTDMSVSSYIGKVKPGFSTYMYINYYNEGTVACNDTITLTFDTLLHFQSSTILPAVQSAGLLKFVYSSIQPNSGSNIFILFTVDSNATVGDTVHSYTSINPLAIDSMPYNNIWYEKREVKNAWDPNSKEVNTNHEAIDPDQLLVYTINFQNTGNDTALTVFVIDTLDFNLDVSTIKILGASNSYVFELISPNILKITFPCIMLVDSFTNELLSHGFFRFSIKPILGLTTGASISNTANIYFDFNQPVITNTTYNYVSIAAINESNNNVSQIIISPNPASKQFTIHLSKKAASPADIQIFNLEGKVVYAQNNVSGDRIIINAENWVPGIYVVKLFVNLKNYYGKLCILKQ